MHKPGFSTTDNKFKPDRNLYKTKKLFMVITRNS